MAEGFNDNRTPNSLPGANAAQSKTSRIGSELSADQPNADN
jgi:hypothetical protein